MTHEGFLASVPLFAMLDAGERNDLLRATKPFSFPAGHVIFEQGDAPDGMYVLERGRVQLWTRLLGEEQLALGEVGPGGLLGEYALIDRGDRSASAEVMEPAQGCFLSLRLFELLRADHRPAARKVMHELRMSLCRRSRAASAALADAPPAFYAYTQWSRRLASAESAERASPSQLDLARLRVMPFFAQFSTAELGSLLAPWILWKLPRGHVVFSDGDAPGSAYLTVRGAVEVVVSPVTASAATGGVAVTPPALSAPRRTRMLASAILVGSANGSAGGNSPLGVRPIEVAISPACASKPSV